MGTERDSVLLEIAEAIGDDSPVDWQAGSSSDPRQADLITHLQRLEVLAKGFRGLQQTPMKDPEDGDPPATWGHLELKERLGEGSFGEVFRASDPLLQRDVALKLRYHGPSRDEGSGRRFIAEARRLARIRHDNVVAVHGADLCDGRVGLWTELIDGSSLEERLREDGPFGVHETVAIGIDLCRALAAVHGAGLIHGDVKAANVLREIGGRIVLTDFGSGAERGAEGVQFGSPASVAPEMLEGGPADPRSDLYSLGVLLFKLLTNELPMIADSPRDLLEAHRLGRRRALRDVRPELPGDVIAVVERALAPEPGGRFASAAEMERALTGLFDPQRAGSGPREAVWWRRFGPATAAGAALLVALVGVRVVIRPPVDTNPQDGSTDDVAVAREEPAVPAVTRPVTSLDVQAQLFRDGDDPALLSSGSSVAPGDSLYLELESTEDVHLYILNADSEGRLYVLFPLPGMDIANPLSPGRHRLPGRKSGVSQDWQITSPGGTETLLVVAARERQVELERDLAAVQTAGLDSGGGAPRLLRGIGGLTESSAQAAGAKLAEHVFESMRARQEEAGDVWVRRYELANPPRGIDSEGQDG
jgi:hypothetical protein